MRSFLICTLVYVVACNDDREFVGDDGLHQLALTADTAPAFVSEEGDAIFVVETRIDLLIVSPTEMARQDLRMGVREVGDHPFPRLPWVERGQMQLELDFTLSSLSDQESEVAVIINGFNEFHEYMPGVTLIDDEPVADFSQWEKLYKLEPGERITRTVREEDLDEVAVDLATVVNGAPNPQQIVFFENKSSSDERSAQYIPDVIPGLAGFRLGLRSNAASPTVLEASLRIRDIEGKLAREGEELLRTQPQPFVPSLVADEEMN